YRVPVGDQWSHADGLSGLKLEERLHVAPLSPADVGEGVVDSTQLVGGVISSGSVGPADHQLELFFKVGSALDLHTHIADDHHAPLQARDLGRALDGRV